MELSHPVFNALQAKRPFLYAAAVLSSLFFLWAAARMPFLLVPLLVGIFAIAFFSSRTFRWLIFTGMLAFSFFIEIATDLPFQFAGLHVRPIDWIAILLVGTVLLTKAVSGERKWVRTGLDGPIWLFLGVLGLSLAQAANLKAGVVNWGHQVLYFLAFYAMVADWPEVRLEDLWKAFLFWTLPTVLSAVWQFFATRGARSLGWSSLGLNHVVLPLLCFHLTALSLWGKAWRWLFAALLLLAVVATQTRGVWIGAGVIILFWLVSGYFVARSKARLSIRRITFPFVGLLLALFLILLFLAPILGEVRERAEQLSAYSGTVYLRLFLWGEALKFFADHPLTGVGVGQFAEAVERMPEAKNLGVFLYTRGLSAHNVFFTFLAEAGLPGGLALLILLFAPVRLAWRAVQRAQTLAELRFGWGLFLYFGYLLLTVFVSGSWEYYVSFFMALLVLFERRLPAGGEVR